MVKNYLNKISTLVIVIFVLTFSILGAKESYSDLFIKITDTKTALRDNNKEEASRLFSEIKSDFEKVKNSNSPQGQKVKKVLDSTKDISENDLRNLATELLAFEKEQNPVDDEAEKRNFKSKIFPALEVLEKSINSKNIEQMKIEYKNFNSIWTRNEKVIRDRSTAYYGKVETAISFLRSSMEVEPFNYENTINSFNDIKSSIQDFLDGKEINQVSQNVTLKDAIDLLKKGLENFKNGNTSEGQANIKEFIQIWPTVEGDVSTRNGSLYTKVETETPVIMVKGGEVKYQEQLETLITELSQIDTRAEYTFVDAMLILLREGVEALLILLALASGLKAANQRKGLKWVYLGGVSGIIASGIIAIMLQQLFPGVSSATNRELLEGYVGIFAVVMMIGIGMWLHSKSSLKAWKEYMNKQLNIVTTTGSFISMFTLSFLAVFREGAETILFYVGILPLISIQNLIIGILSALGVLVIIALVLIYATSKIKIHKMFLILTWLIYFLAFKMLGVSIHMLQVVGIVPLHLIKFIPTIEVLGIYANLEVVISQLILIIIIYITTRRKK